MQERLRQNLQSLGDKTPAYLFERYVGRISCFVSVIFALSIDANYIISLNDAFIFVSDKVFLDKLITICTTLFGFLLTVLTLIIQSTSETILVMRRHGSYRRLIRFNKNIVVLSAVVCVLSLFAILIKDEQPLDLTNIAFIGCAINFGLFVWTIIDTLLFVNIFYKIQLND